ncbi:amidophosphoribosyltransferase-like protein [Paenibacillus curdlanolyticus YK9]|uniref:Amidophosphoribosyltransferase-like protein n=1 Tax=Paenibacillus curdlanolyticus YK9 TaxID=717606 RepID=E0IED7_9BACL|nr:ComF family protein [Paenibacillus curdlanolyticus]EFM09025.1 amidophosphoribosyltransferase-like protein [Paenibacillus curdlanolyticus YK9]
MIWPLRYLITQCRTAADQFASLLSPSPSPCPLCSLPAHKAALFPIQVSALLPSSSMLRQLCKSCSEQLPWINAIACAVCGRPGPCNDCARRSEAYFISNRSAVRYDDRIRECLALFKYRGDEKLSAPLSDLLAYAFRRLELELLSRSQNFSVKWEAVVPVPVSEERLLERGFNQAELLARQLCTQRNLPLVELLIRTRHSEKKSLQSRHARMQSADGLFAIDQAALERHFTRGSLSIASAASPQHPRHNQQSILRLLIVDDIYTTGSTVNACAQVLKEALQGHIPQAEVQVYAITVARSG